MLNLFLILMLAIYTISLVNLIIYCAIYNIDIDTIIVLTLFVPIVNTICCCALLWSNWCDKNSNNDDEPCLMKH